MGSREAGREGEGTAHGASQALPSVRAVGPCAPGVHLRVPVPTSRAGWNNEKADGGLGTGSEFNMTDKTVT